jgi:hypothetical protein
MEYKLQKILLNNCNVYNILFEDNILGHVLINDENTIVIQTDELSIVPIVESFGFSGEALLADENGYQTVMLKGNLDLAPLYEYKVIDLQDQFLTEEEI